jgi:hypothetical protein
MRQISFILMELMEKFEKPRLALGQWVLEHAATHTHEE